MVSTKSRFNFINITIARDYLSFRRFCHNTTSANKIIQQRYSKIYVNVHLINKSHTKSVIYQVFNHSKFECERIRQEIIEEGN